MHELITTFLGISIAEAQTRVSPVATFVGKINRLILNPLITLMFAVALMYFIYGVMQFLANGAEKRTEAKNSMLYGILGMSIMFGVYGIIKIIEATLGVSNVNPNL